MPQASDETRAKMERMFGDPISEAGPIQYLKSAGYKLRRDWHWEPKPGVAELRDMTRDEFDCLLFLVHEWDFGGLALQAPKVQS